MRKFAIFLYAKITKFEKDQINPQNILKNDKLFLYLRPNKRNRTMQKTFSIFSILLFVIVFSQCTNDHRVLQRRLQQEAAIVNTATPIMLNNYIRFDGASVTPENRFLYHYSVLHTANPDSLVESTLQDFKHMVRIAYFTSPEMAVFRENNVILEWIFSDENGRTIRTVTVTPDDIN